MNTTQNDPRQSYSTLRRDLDTAVDAVRHWAVRIADNAIAGAPLDPTLVSLYRESEEHRAEAEQLLNAWIADHSPRRTPDNGTATNNARSIPAAEASA